MKIDINTILQEVGEAYTVDYDEEFPEPLADDLVLKEPVRIHVTFTNTGLGILVKGTMETNLDLVCSTCLNVFNYPFALAFEERFVPDQPFLEEGLEEEYEIKGNEDFFYTYHENEIDLQEMVRELLILNLPIAPKCDINCKVKNLMPNKIVDPRLKILEKLKDQNK